MKKIIGYGSMILLLLILIILLFKVLKSSKIEYEETNMKEIYLKVNNEILEIEVENNISVQKLIEILKNEDIQITASDYGNFEKVGSLGFDIQSEDRFIKTEVGDIMLYNGNMITIFYDSNSWDYTKIGKIKNVDKEGLINILGKGEIKLTFTLNK